MPDFANPLLTHLCALCNVLASYIQGETDQMDAFVSKFVEKRQQFRVQGAAGSDIVGLVTASSDAKVTNSRGIGKSRTVVGRARRRRPPAPRN